MHLLYNYFAFHALALMIAPRLRMVFCLTKIFILHHDHDYRILSRFTSVIQVHACVSHCNDCS